ncbi:MAG TPA: STAS domain-containing protein [Anaerolineae bacterium]|nr:STAS domain-containing protein [Anaerolineae bacterium]
MQISSRELKRVNVVTVGGRVDSAAAPDLEQTLQSLIDSRRTQIVIELGEVEYMSSAGLRALVSALKAAKKGGGDVVIARPSTRVREVLELAGLTSVFALYDDVVEAVGSF